MTSTEKFESSYFKNRVFDNKHYYMVLEWLRFLKPMNVFDYGAGEGFYIHAFNYLGVPCIGYDISKYAVAHAYGLAQGKLFNEVRTDAGPFDLVTCIDVLEHIPKDQEEGIINELTGLSTKWLILSICDTTLSKRYKDSTHVNIRPRAYWIDKFKKKGWKLMKTPPMMFGDQLYFFIKQ